MPITVTFNEFVNLGNASVTINGKVYSAAELSMNNYGVTAMLWYPVQDTDATTVTVNGMTGVKDVFGHPLDTALYHSDSLTDVTLTSVLMRNAPTALTATYANGIQLALLNGEKNINFGAVFENAAAQELAAHGYALYYFNSKKQGELDFVIEHEGNVLPLEIKSGKDYTRHNALSGVMANPDYHIPAAFVFHGGNVSVKEKITYYPIYMMMFLREPELAQDLTYTPDFGVLMR